MYREFQLNINNYVFAVLVFSVLLNIIRVLIIGRAAKRYKSSVFEAEFLNYLSDIASSVIVITGLLLARKGFVLADPIASITVALIVLVFTFRLSVKIFRNLLDYIPAEITDKVKQSLETIKEVNRINEVRVHEVGNVKFINLNVSIDENIYLSRAEKIKRNIRNSISESIPDSKIILELKPDFAADNIISKVKGIILEDPSIEDIHNVSVYEVGDQIDISLHIMIRKQLSLTETEELTKGIERELKYKIPELRSIYIHIEENRGKESFTDITSRSKKLIERIKAEISDYIDPDTCHNFTILKSGKRFNIAFHCRLNQKLKVDQAHEIITSAEGLLRKKIKHVGDLSIHVEPY